MAYSSSPLHNVVHRVLLVLTMEEAAYLQDRGQGGIRVQCVVHYNDDEYYMYSIAK